MSHSCRGCIHARNCRFRATMLGKRGFAMTDLSDSEQMIVIRASNGVCDLYEQKEVV